MSSATIIVITDNKDEVVAVKEWFARWKDKLRSVSENQGCGCCVSVWKVEGKLDAFLELPASVLSEESWANDKKRLRLED